MRTGRTLTVFIFNAAFAFCALLLVVAFLAVGVGLFALLAVFVGICVLTFIPFFQRTPAPAFARRPLRRYPARAPPRF